MPIDPELLAQLCRPTYENRLRVIGRTLDESDYRSMNVVEIAAGFLVCVMRAGERTPVALEFPHSDFPELLAAAVDSRDASRAPRKRHPLLPTGYEDFLRALGHRLDAAAAEAITITELDSFIAVNGVGQVDAYYQTSIGPFQLLLRPDDIAALIDEAFRRRSKTDRPKLFDRVLGR